MVAVKLLCLLQGLVIIVVGTPVKFNWLGPTLAPIALDADLHVSDRNPQCGQQLIRKSKIVNGQSAYYGEFPWMVSLQHKQGHFCGGTLIHEQWVLTAAHCFADAKRNKDPNSYRVVVGIHRLSSSNQPDTAEKIPVANIITHDLFSASTFTNDIALVKLATPVTWDEYKQPICLPDDNQNDSSPDDAMVIGWGWNKEPGYGGRMSDVLQKVKVNIVSNFDCANWYREAGFPYSFRSGHLCAGFKEGGKDSCVGDSGGPLMKKNGNAYRIIGVVSSGIGCARRLLPGLYTDVVAYLPWIRSKMY